MYGRPSLRAVLGCVAFVAAGVPVVASVVASVVATLENGGSWLIDSSRPKARKRGRGSI